MSPQGVTGPQWVNMQYCLPISTSHWLYTQFSLHYNDVIMGAITSQITSLTIVFSTVYLDTDQSKHQSSASLAFVRGIHRRPVNSPHKWPVNRKMFPFDDVIKCCALILIGASDFNTLRPRQNGRYFADGIFKRIFWTKMFEFWSKFHWSLFPRNQFKTSHHCFR